MVQVKLKRIGVLKTSLYMCLTGLLIGIIFAIILIISTQLSGSSASSVGLISVLPIASILLIPIIFAIMGFISGIIFIPLSNLVLNLIKGIDLELEETENIN